MIIRHDRIRNFNALDFHRLIEVSRFAFYGFKAFGFGLLPCRLYVKKYCLIFFVSSRI